MSIQSSSLDAYRTDYSSLSHALHIAVFVDHSRLMETDLTSIQFLLKISDQQGSTLYDQAKQLHIGTLSFLTKEAVRRAEIGFCVNPKYPIFVIALSITEGNHRMRSVVNDRLKRYLKMK